MYKFKRILVGLDLSELDEQLIRYTFFINKIVKPERVYFVHIIKDFEVPEEVKEALSISRVSVDERIKNEIKKKVEKYSGKSDAKKIDIEIKEGNPADKILKWADIKEVDLIIMGSKRELKGSGILPGKMVKLSHCSILLVPEKVKPSISRILVPVDFSENSKMAMEQANDIAKAVNAELICHHSYAVPSGYHVSGKSFEEFAEIMKGHAEKEFVRFLKESKVESKTPCHFTLDDRLQHDPAEQAFEIASKEKVDLIVIGSRGRKSIASIILGSIAEKMTRYDKDVPLLVVKNKDDNLGFFRALMKL